MKIEQVKTAFKIADVKFVQGSTKLNFNYLKDLKNEKGEPLPQRILSENVARVYLIVVDGEIKKQVEAKQQAVSKALQRFIETAE